MKEIVSGAMSVVACVASVSEETGFSVACLRGKWGESQKERSIYQSFSFDQLKLACCLLCFRHNVESERN